MSNNELPTPESVDQGLHQLQGQLEHHAEATAVEQVSAGDAAFAKLAAEQQPQAEATAQSAAPVEQPQEVAHV